MDNDNHPFGEPPRQPQAAEPSPWDVWLARGLLVVGLWFTGSGLFDLVRALPAHWADLLVHAPGIGAGVLFLAGAWRMRAVLRWDPGDDG
ncbi:hypothetical protein FJQ54_04780 [Sandaracinobacter neustonicus]|uniref:Uncharacterized protein n=1 Tax=Sandaracinobacter neustonicus TaxID=1715348 RepID=A0A501XQL4_9SPHN|nr:hypothetical protein [Sandaracinobacter neustonicus]TPE62840.1 hypothetical protein FJQ54_04780 [Sandaracinobacter neustonicus]